MFATARLDRGGGAGNVQAQYVFLGGTLANARGKIDNAGVFLFRWHCDPF